MGQQVVNLTKADKEWVLGVSIMELSAGDRVSLLWSILFLPVLLNFSVLS